MAQIDTRSNAWQEEKKNTKYINKLMLRITLHSLVSCAHTPVAPAQLVGHSSYFACISFF
jgi:hypothetical protein